MKTLIDIDEDALTQAQAALGTSTKKETVNTALRQAAEAHRRQLALVAELAAGGGIYRRAIDDEDGAWS